MHGAEQYGAASDGHTTFINAAVLSRPMVADRPPIVFDLPIHV